MSGRWAPKSRSNCRPGGRHGRESHDLSRAANRCCAGTVSTWPASRKGHAGEHHHQRHADRNPSIASGSRTSSRTVTVSMAAAQPSCTNDRARAPSPSRWPRLRISTSRAFGRHQPRGAGRKRWTRCPDLGRAVRTCVAARRMMHHRGLVAGASDGDRSAGRSTSGEPLVWTTRGPASMPDGAGPAVVLDRIHCGWAARRSTSTPRRRVPVKDGHRPRSTKAGNPPRAGVTERSVAVLADMRTQSVFAGDNITDCQPLLTAGLCGGCRAYHMAQSGSVNRKLRALCRVLSATR